MYFFSAKEKRYYFFYTKTKDKDKDTENISSSVGLQTSWAWVNEPGPAQPGPVDEGTRSAVVGWRKSALGGRVRRASEV